MMDKKTENENIAVEQNSAYKEAEAINNCIIGDGKLAYLR